MTTPWAWPPDGQRPAHGLHLPAGFFDKQAGGFKLSDYFGGHRVRLGTLSVAEAAEAARHITELPAGAAAAPAGGLSQAPYYEIDMYPSPELGAGRTLINARVRSVAFASGA
jgi:hypothetical protein